MISFVKGVSASVISLIGMNHKQNLYDLLREKSICLCLVQESRYFGGFAALPDGGERVFLQNSPVGK